MVDIEQKIKKCNGIYAYGINIDDGVFGKHTICIDDDDCKKPSVYFTFSDMNENICLDFTKGFNEIREYHVDSNCDKLLLSMIYDIRKPYYNTNAEDVQLYYKNLDYLTRLSYLLFGI